jgi:hypothetical protein
MSNPLSVRRVKVQTINEKGEPEGEPTYGVMAADGYAQAYNDIYRSLEELNAAIQEAGCILDVVESDDFDNADREKIGTDNFYRKDWEKNDELRQNA